MSEQVRHASETLGRGPGSWSDPFAPPDQGNLARVSSAADQSELLPVAGMTVGDIRRRLADRLNIDPQGRAVVGGVEVDDHVVVRAGQSLFFKRAGGEKGRGRVAWPNRTPRE